MTDVACSMSCAVPGSSSMLRSVAQDVVQQQALRSDEDMLLDWPEDIAAPTRCIKLYSKRFGQYWRATRLCD